MTMSPTSKDGQAAARLHPKSSHLILLGVAMLGLGGAAAAVPLLASLAAGALAGWLLWLAGAALVGLGLLLSPSRVGVSGLAAGAFVVGCGAFLTFQPAVGAVALAVLLAAVFVVDGSFQVALALHLRPVKAWRWVLASAFASLVAAALLAAGAPERSQATLGLVLGLAFATTGAALLAIGLRRHD